MSEEHPSSPQKLEGADESATQKEGQEKLRLAPYRVCDSENLVVTPPPMNSDSDVAVKNKNLHGYVTSVGVHHEQVETFESVT